MENIKVGIMEPQDFSINAIEKLKNVVDVELYNNQNIEKFIEDKDALFIRLKYFIDDKFIQNARKLKYICSPTTGLNHICINNDNIEIISLKGEYSFLDSIRATPEHVIGLTLSLLRNYSHAFLNGNNKLWNRELYKGYELYNSNVGIIGLGRVGKIVSKYLEAFESNVYYYDIAEKTEYENNLKKCDSIESLINNCSVIILATNYTEENSKMINKHYLSMMKDKYFINASRGELVDEQVLLSLIQKKHFKGVAIDVLESETLGDPLLEEFIKCQAENNLVITPHIGGATYSSMMRTEEYIVDKLLSKL